MPRSPRNAALLSLSLLGLLAWSMPGKAQAADTPSLSELRQALPGANVGVDTRFGSVRSLTIRGGQPLSAPAGDAHAAVAAFLARHASAFGDAQMLADAAIEREWTNPRVAVHTIIWQQALDGIPVQDGRLTAHLRPDNAILAMVKAMVPEPRLRSSRAHASGAPQPRLSAQDALAIACGSAPAGLIAHDQSASAASFGAPGYSGPLECRLVWAVDGAELVQAGQVNEATSENPNRWRTTLDALDGAVLSRVSLTRFSSAPGATAGHQPRLSSHPQTSSAGTTPAWTPPRASSGPRLNGMTQPFTLAVFAPASVFINNDPSDIAVCGESPTPYLPGYLGQVAYADNACPYMPVASPSLPPGYPGGAYPQTRQIYTQSGPTPESPDGWIDDGNTFTGGNNVVAGTAPNGGGTPTPLNGTGAGRTVQPIMGSVQTADPTPYSGEAVINLFYWDNFMHDRLYDLGFTEPAGNFQQNNFGLGGNQFDPVEAEAQFDWAGGAVDSTFFATAGDGSYTLQGMMLYNGPNIVTNLQAARRDSDLDATLILQSYGMGVATRLVGGGAQLSSLQSVGLQSGWGDFISLALLTPPGADLTSAYPIGAWSALDYLGAANYSNYFQGVRRFPTTTQIGISPYTLGEIDGQAVSNPPLVTDGQQPQGDAAPNNQGEIWCNALWQARSDWINLMAGPSPGNDFANPGYQAAYKAANDQFLALVLAGMQLCPPQPTYTEARDALLLADTVAPFTGAEQALLWNAFAVRGLGPQAQTGPAMDTSLTEDLTGPQTLLVNGGTGYQGAEPGMVSTANQSTSYTLTNLSGAALDWGAASDSPWMAATPANGVLAAGQSITVVVAPTAAADTLPIGQFNATISFSDTADTGTSRVIELDVAGIYVAASANYQWLTPVPQTVLATSNDSFTPITLPFQFAFYSQKYLQLQVGANGLISFQPPTGNAAAHSAFNVPLGSPFPVNDLICPLWWDLNPDLGGTISWGIVGTPPFRVAVITWNGVPPGKNLQTAGGKPLTFQVQLSESTNLITYAYQNLQQAQPYGGGKYASVGVEDQRGIIHTQWQVPGAVAIPDHSAISLTYSVPPGFTQTSIGALNDGGSSQCGIGFGAPAVLIGSLVWLRRRLRRSASAVRQPT